MQSTERTEDTGRVCGCWGVFTHEREGKNAKVSSKQTPFLRARESALAKGPVNEAQFMNTVESLMTRL